MDNKLDAYSRSIIENMCRHFQYNLIQIDFQGEAEIWGIEKVNSQGKRIKMIFTRERNKGAYEKSDIQQDECIEITFIRPDEAYNISTLNNNGVVVIDYINSKIVDYNQLVEVDILNEIGSCVSFLSGTRENKKEISQYYLITYIIISINLLMYFITATMSGDFITSNTDVLIQLGGKVNRLISEGEYYRLITCMFLHAGLVHILLNMYALYSIGPLIEKIFGRSKYVLIYILSGILSSLLSYIMSPYLSIGASGAIFGLLGALLIYSYKMRARIGMGLIKNIAIILVVNVFISLTIPNIDMFAHLGGLIGGVVISFILLYKVDAD